MEKVIKTINIELYRNHFEEATNVVAQTLFPIDKNNKIILIKEKYINDIFPSCELPNDLSLGFLIHRLDLHNVLANMHRGLDLHRLKIDALRTYVNNYL